MDKLINVITAGVGLFNIVAILIIITVHSFTKAAVSMALLDRQPKDAGRLTLNPFKHFEWIGFLLMFFTSGMGWDKPMKTSTLFYKNKKTGALLVHGIPMLACVVFSIAMIALKNHVLPIVGLEAGSVGYVVAYGLFDMIAIIGIKFAVFNLIPIYPMDGSAILRAYLSPNQSLNYTRMEGILQLVLVFAVMFGILDAVINPIVGILYAIVNMI